MLLGDTHGNTEHLAKAAKIAKRNGVDRIIQLGDFGFLFRENRLKSVENTLKQFGSIPLIWLDGNHENFDMLAELGATPQDDEPTQLTPLVTYSPRGYVWDFDGVTFMTMGGAFSVDYEHRTLGVSLWHQETITYADVEKACGRGPVDVLLTHDAPEMPENLYAMMIRMGFDRDGYKTDASSKSNRIAVTAVMQAVEPALLVHGHFHHRYNDKLANTIIVGLGRDTMGNLSWVIVDTERLGQQIAEIDDARSALGRG